MNKNFTVIRFPVDTKTAKIYIDFQENFTFKISKVILSFFKQIKMIDKLLENEKKNSILLITSIQDIDKKEEIIIEHLRKMLDSAENLDCSLNKLYEDLESIDLEHIT